GRARVEHAPHHDRVALDLRTVVRTLVSRTVDPGRLQSGHVGGVDLGEGRVLGVTRVAAVEAPGSVWGGSGGAGLSQGRQAGRGGERQRQQGLRPRSRGGVHGFPFVPGRRAYRGVPARAPREPSALGMEYHSNIEDNRRVENPLTTRAALLLALRSG